jgi:hypothetical protein
MYAMSPRSCSKSCSSPTLLFRCRAIWCRTAGSPNPTRRPCKAWRVTASATRTRWR